MTGMTRVTGMTVVTGMTRTTRGTGITGMTRIMMTLNGDD